MQNLAGRIILASSWPRRFWAFLSGAILTLTLAPFDFFPAGFVSFIILVWLMDGTVSPVGAGFLRKLRPFFALGWWFGFGYGVAGLWWIGNALLVEADMFAWALPLAVLGLPAMLALFFGFGTMLAGILWSDRAGRIFALAFGLVASEALRGFVLTGFPWNSLGHTVASNVNFMQSASLIGIEGMAALAIVIFASPALLIDPKGQKAAIGMPLVLLGAMTVFGLLRLPALAPNLESAGDDHIVVRIVQPSIDQSEKWDVEAQNDIFAQLITLSVDDEAAKPDLDKIEAPEEGAILAPSTMDNDDAAEDAAQTLRPDLIIWPETALPFLLEQRPDAFSEIQAVLQEGQILLTGGVRVEGDGDQSRFYNSVIGISAEGEIVAAADKVHLVPFGEYLPLGSWLERLGLQTITKAAGGFSAGSERRSLELGGKFPSLLPLICYEAIFSNEVIASLGDADVLLNITNDAWYGNSPGPYQHFRQAQLRAVETGRPLIRSANNGLSGFVDPYGRIAGGLALNAIGVSDHVMGADRVETMFSRFYPFTLMSILGFLLLMSAAMKLRRTTYETL